MNICCDPGSSTVRRHGGIRSLPKECLGCEDSHANCHREANLTGAAGNGRGLSLVNRTNSATKVSNLHSNKKNAGCQQQANSQLAGSGRLQQQQRVLVFAGLEGPSQSKLQETIRLQSKRSCVEGMRLLQERLELNRGYSHEQTQCQRVGLGLGLGLGSGLGLGLGLGSVRGGLGLGQAHLMSINDKETVVSREFYNSKAREECYLGQDQKQQSQSQPFMYRYDESIICSHEIEGNFIMVRQHSIDGEGWRLGLGVERRALLMCSIKQIDRKCLESVSKEIGLYWDMEKGRAKQGQGSGQASGQGSGQGQGSWQALGQGSGSAAVLGLYQVYLDSRLMMVKEPYECTLAQYIQNNRGGLGLCGGASWLAGEIKQIVGSVDSLMRGLGAARERPVALTDLVYVCGSFKLHSLDMYSSSSGRVEATAGCQTEEWLYNQLSVMVGPSQ